MIRKGYISSLTIGFTVNSCPYAKIAKIFTPLKRKGPEDVRDVVIMLALDIRNPMIPNPIDRIGPERTSQAHYL